MDSRVGYLGFPGPKRQRFEARRAQLKAKGVLGWNSHTAKSDKVRVKIHIVCHIGRW